MGTYMTMITPQWDHRAVQDFSELEKLWDTVKDSNPEILAGRLAEDLKTQLDLLMVTMLGPESKFFKQHYRSNWHNQGVMIQEIDMIRQQEGW
jgi:cellobiose-specific phosphotransferase system component IIB